jgi:hypothetical protein
MVYLNLKATALVFVIDNSLLNWSQKTNFLIKQIGFHVLNAKNKTNSVAWVREGTIPTERPPLVGEDSANFSG